MYVHAYAHVNCVMWMLCDNKMAYYKTEITAVDLDLAF